MFTACNNEEYVSPTFPEGVIPTVMIEGADELATGIFSAVSLETQTFNILIDSAESLFPDVSDANVLVEISDDTNFTFGYTAGESTFTVVPKYVNSTSASYSAYVTASIDDIYGGNTYTLEVEQEPAYIPHFTTQPSDVTFAENFSLGDTASTVFAIDPADVTTIDIDSFTVTESEYYIATITDSGNYIYTVTFELTMSAVNQISLSDSSIVVECNISLNYSNVTEMSDTFNVTLTKSIDDE